MNNFNPYSYQPQPIPQMPTINRNNINWVQGLEGAKAWQLQPNSNILLMDSENDGIFYIKVTDNVGMCTMRTFRYEEITDFGKNAPDLSQYVTKDELVTILDQRIGGKNGKQSVQSTKQSADE